MKLISNDIQKVNFHGINISIPSGYKFITSDGKGFVHIFQHKLIPIDNFEIWASTGGHASVATVGLESMKWIDTLQKFNSPHLVNLIPYTFHYAKASFLVAVRFGFVLKIERGFSWNHPQNQPPS